MNIENTQSQMKKGVLEFCILSIIRRGEAYPSDIIEEMKKADLLSYRWVESQSGPPRKYFSLTDKGLSFYAELEATWRGMSSAVERVINAEGQGTRDEGQENTEGREKREEGEQPFTVDS